jgi:hypothetical protein
MPRLTIIAAAITLIAGGWEVSGSASWNYAERRTERGNK